MKVLFIAPLPPPVTGHSLAAQALFNELSLANEIYLVDLSKDSFIGGADTFKRYLEIYGVIRKVFKNRKADTLYFTISESVAGNIKDLIIYLICFKQLPKMFIHLHGGSIKRLLFDKYKILCIINKFFISRLAGAIVLGPSHVEIFKGMLPVEKVHVVPNFAHENLFLEQKKIIAKFENLVPLKLLFLSNLISGKGYIELLDAYISLEKELKERISLNFAGAFESENQKESFLMKIENLKMVNYHGIVGGDEKTKLLSESHVFCLPTCLFEGQPISILEAYASGCVVLSTTSGGIVDIFQDGINGYEVPPASVSGIKCAIERIVKDSQKLQIIGSNNRKTAEELYRISIYNNSLKQIMQLS